MSDAAYTAQDLDRDLVGSLKAAAEPSGFGGAFKRMAAQLYPDGAAQAAPAPADVISGEAVYNRTLDGIFAKLPYVHYEARKEVFRKHGARTAYTFRDKKLVPIMYSERMHTQGPTRDFRRFATAWELRHSKVPFGDGHGNVFPVVDENMVVVGHYGSFDASDIYVPADLPSDGKVEEVSSGGRVYTGGKVHNVYVPGQRFVRVVKSKLFAQGHVGSGDSGFREQVRRGELPEPWLPTL